MPDERRKTKAAVPLAILLAILFRLFVLAEEVAEKDLQVPVAAGGALAEAVVTISGPRILLWSVRPENVAVVFAAPAAGEGEPQVRTPRGTRLVAVRFPAAGGEVPAAK